MPQESTYTITDGPSKWGLILALFENTAREPRDVRFNVEGSLATLNITRIEREDGSGESWLFRGYVTQVKDNDPARHSVSAEGYYSTKKRSGWLRFVD